MSEINSLNKIEVPVAEFLNSIPPDVMLVAASKTRTPDEVQAAISAGVKIVGYNYMQEAERIYQAIRELIQMNSTITKIVRMISNN